MRLRSLRERQNYGWGARALLHSPDHGKHEADERVAHDVRRDAAGDAVEVRVVARVGQADVLRRDVPDLVEDHVEL